MDLYVVFFSYSATIITFKHYACTFYNSYIDVLGTREQLSQFCNFILSGYRASGEKD